MSRTATRRRGENAPPGRWPKQVLAVRNLILRTAWLQGRIRWHGDRLGWEAEDGVTLPGPRELSRAQRAIYDLRRYPTSARLTVGDPARWEAETQARLETAKRLSSLTAGDLAPDRFCGRPAAGDSATIARLLEAEALADGSLPASPVARIADSRAFARWAPVLRGIAADEDASFRVRLLAALALGAAQAEGGSVVGDDSGALPAPARRALRWGREFRLEVEPAIIAALLEREDGWELAERARRALLLLAGEDLLADGAAIWRAQCEQPARAVELVESLVGALGLRRFLRHRLLELVGRVNGYDRRTRQPAPQPGAIQTSVDPFWMLLLELAVSAVDAGTVGAAARLMEHLAALCYPVPELLPHLLRPFEHASRLAGDRRSDFMELLLERAPTIWVPEEPPAGARAWTWWRNWLIRCENDEIMPVYRMLRAGASSAFIREIGDARTMDCLLGSLSHSLEGMRLALDWGRETGCATDYWFCRCINDLCTRAGSPAAARQALWLFLPPLRDLDPEARRNVGHSCIGLLEEAPEPPLERARRLVPLLSCLAGVPFASCPPGVYGGDVLEAALVLGCGSDHDGSRHFEQLLRWLREEPAHNPKFSMEHRGFGAARVAAGLGSNCEEAVRAAWTLLRTDCKQDLRTVEEALPILQPLCSLRESLLALLPVQRGRCLDFLERIGRAARYPRELQSVLQALQYGPAEEAPLPGRWPELAADPRTVRLANRYVTARSLHGLSTEPPASLHRTAAMSVRLATEVKHLAARMAQGTASAAQEARLHHLQERLTDPDSLTRAAAVEIEERLRMLAAEAQLAAAEFLVERVYRQRLEELAGPLPEGFAFTDDLLNAMILSDSIRTNRRLLRRLLRAAATGDPHWVQRHSANTAFLQSLATRGADPELWLSAFPRRFRCTGTAGGWVRLRLETDPLRVLQMGNYFQTCLSRDGCNAFSAVTNACELNKRVIYATDMAGRVVGRKLIGLSAGGALVGFHTYCSLTESAAAALRDATHRYARRFASACGLELADEGTIPRLFTVDWYDDGVVSWTDEDSAMPTSPPNAATSPPPSAAGGRQVRR